MNRTILLVAILMITMPGASRIRANAAADAAAKPKAASAEAEKAWEEFVKASQLLPQPASWQTSPPNPDEISAFRQKVGVAAGEAADKAHTFYKNFPEHGMATEARKRQLQLLGVAVQLGNTNRVGEWRAAEEAVVKLPDVSEDERFMVQLNGLAQRVVFSSEPGLTNLLTGVDSRLEALQKEFPSRSEVGQVQLMLAEQLASQNAVQKARDLATQLTEGKQPDQIKEEARAFLTKTAVAGRPLELSFKAVDGRAVDIAKMRGKVVLVDFWATWCGPCIAGLPDVKEVYAKYHPRGFEIVAISFDHDKAALTGFVSKEKMDWPQYFDGKGWENIIGQKYGIHSIPTMWLVDKKGIVRELNARQNLGAKVEKLLGEKAE